MTVHGRTATLAAGAALLLSVVATPDAGASDPAPAPKAFVAAPRAALATQPNIFFYNLDDLRDAFPGAIDPMQFMPKTLAWMAQGSRYSQTFVTNPACTPSRASMMTGRYPHNNGVTQQSQGPDLDFVHSGTCYLQAAGYATYLDGKFLTTWPHNQKPPCFDHSTVMWSGYRNAKMNFDGVLNSTKGYTTTVLGNRGRDYITSALNQTKPFMLYEPPQAPHWVAVKNPDGTTSDLAVPEAKYADAPIGHCAGVPEADRSDKPAYVRFRDFTTAQGQQMCESQLRAIMSADDEFDKTMQLLSDRGVLDNTLVIFSSDNGYNWGEHGRTEKFVPYEPSLRVPLLVRWPGHIDAGTNANRIVSYDDLFPTMMEAGGVTIPAGAPQPDAESLLHQTQRTTMFSEYDKDPANGKASTWKMVRTHTIKYIQTYDPNGNVIFREYYNLTNDPAENTNLLHDGNAANDPPQSEINALTAKLNAFATCAGSNCVK